jgi:hypothetical protein
LLALSYLSMKQVFTWLRERGVSSVLISAAIIAGLLLLTSQVLVQMRYCSYGLLCMWEVSKHPLWIAVIAWGLASEYQTRRQTRDLRFTVFERCATAQTRLSAASGRVLTVRALLRAFNNPSLQVRGNREEYLLEEETAERELDAAYSEAASLAVVASAVFSESTQAIWVEVLRRFAAFRFQNSLRASRLALVEASDLYGEFINAAAREMSSRFRPVKVALPERDDTSSQVDRFIDLLEPQAR